MIKLTPFQQEAIGQDGNVLLSSATGTGKTLAYGLALIEQIQIEERLQGIIICPTRELCFQVAKMLEPYTRPKRISTLVCVGKHPIEQQIEDLRSRVHILIGTCGRLIDLLELQAFGLDQVKRTIVDEADALFAQHLEPQLTQLSPKQRWAVTASPNDEVKNWLKDFHWLQGDNQPQARVYYAKTSDRLAWLQTHLHELGLHRALIFCQRQATAQMLEQSLAYPRLAAYHGGLLQEQREVILESFRQGQLRILICTDLASRGLDVDQIDLVIEYDQALDEQTSLHRIGRTGRFFGQTATLVFSTTKEDLPHFGGPDLSEPISASRSFQAEGVTRLWINAGRSKKLSAKDIVGAFIEKGIPADQIGRISIEQHVSFVDVLRGHEKKVIGQQVIKKKKVRIEKSQR